jgi:hypothetical protein
MSKETITLELEKEEIDVLKKILLDKQVSILTNVIKDDLSKESKLFCTIVHIIGKIEINEK